MPGIAIAQVVDEHGARDWHAVDDATRRVDHEELPADPLPEVLARLRLDDGSANASSCGCSATATSRWPPARWASRPATTSTPPTSTCGCTRAPAGDDLIHRLRAGAQAAAGDYALLQWVDRVPEPDAPAMAALNAQMALDVPREDLEWEPEVWDVARLRASEDELLDRGRRVVATAARHRASGELVGFSNIAVSTVRPRVGFQFDTLVVAAHRGHRLGMLMKAANLQLLRTELPATRYLNTWNAAVNDHMVAINDALGFRPVERWRDWQLPLPARG